MYEKILKSKCTSRPSGYKYPYPIEWENHEWKNSNNIKCTYNYYRKENILLNGKNSGSLLYETCKENDPILYSISRILHDWHGKNNQNKTVYGVKNCNGKYTWELYNPHPLDRGINGKIADCIAPK
jgi:hypothetical protein